MVVDRLLDWTRRRSPMGQALRRAAVSLSQWSLPPGALHRALLVERSLRAQLLDELARALYWQPMFAAQCARADRSFRLEIAPDSKLPPVIHCRLTVGPRVRLSARTTFSGARNAPQIPPIVIGEDTYIGHRNVVRAGLGISIGKRCFFAGNVFVSGDPGHPLDPIRRRTEAAPLEELGRIEIGDDVWIAEGAAVLGNVRIGDGAVIAARAVVTKDVPPRALVAGSPARVLRIIGEAPAGNEARLPLVANEARPDSLTQPGGLG